MSARLGVSESAFVEAVLLHVRDELNDNGVPTWWAAEPTLLDGVEKPFKSATKEDAPA